MSSNALLAGIPISKSGLNYLVPTTWYFPPHSGGTNFTRSIATPILPLFRFFPSIFTITRISVLK